MSWREEYRRKLKTADEALSLLRSSQRVWVQQGNSTPQPLIDAMIRRAPVLRDVQVISMLTLGDAPYTRPEFAGTFRHGGLFLGGNVREDFAVEGALGGLQALHETAVGEAGGAGGGVDADLPERPVVALLGATIAVSILAGMVHRVRGVTVEFGTAHPEAFSGSDHAGAAFAGGRGVGNTHRLGKG